MVFLELQRLSCSFFFFYSYFTLDLSRHDVAPLGICNFISNFQKIELTSHFLQIVEEGRVYVGRDCHPLPYVGPSKRRKCYRFSLRFSATVSRSSRMIEL